MFSLLPLNPGLTWGQTSVVEILSVGQPHDALYAVSVAGERIRTAGAHGLVKESTDGGASWHRVAYGESAVLGISEMPDGGALAVGQGGRLLRIHSGKMSAIASPVEARLFSVAIADDGASVAVGEFGTLLISTDAGASWRAVDADWSSIPDLLDVPHLYAVATSGEGEFIAAGEFGIVLRRGAALDDWIPVYQGDRSVFALTVDSSGDYWGVGQGGLVIVSTDAGLTWEDRTGSVQHNLFDVGVDEGGAAIVLGEAGAWASTDGGMSWDPLSVALPGAARLNALRRGSDGSFLGVGDHGVVVRLRLLRD